MIPPPELDLAVGMEVYASVSPRCRGRIKAQAEDFLVEESLGGLRVFPDPAGGLLPLYRVEKRLIDTMHLEAELSAVLKSRISFAGLKDKRAVAVQYATPTSTRSERPRLVEGKAFRAELVGYVERPLSRGLVEGNRFRVRLRDCPPEIEDSVREVYALAGEKRLPNFYGLQRFGGRGALTHRVGRVIIKRKFEDAVRIILGEPGESDDQPTGERRDGIAQGNHEDSKLPRRGRDVETRVARRWATDPGDPIGALRAVPIRLRKLYTQAYQSYIFNRTLSLAISRSLDISSLEKGDNWGDVSPDGMVLGRVHGVREVQAPGGVPLIQLAGYAYRDYGSRFDACAGEVMAEEEVAARDFYVEEMQEVSVEGGFRRPHLVAKDESCEVRGDVSDLGFTLARGEYATVLLREIVKPDDPVAQGFA